MAEPPATASESVDDLAAVHALLDARIMPFSQEMLGWTWTNRIGGMTEAEGKTYQVVSPIDRRVALGSFHTADAASVDRAVRAARFAFEVWRIQPWGERVTAFRRVATELDRIRYDLAIATLLEVGKSRADALAEVAEAVEGVTECCDRMENHQGYAPAGPKSFAPQRQTVSEPLGVFAVIAPFNEPLAAALRMIVPALLAGNAVVFKPGESAGMTGLTLADAFLRAGIMPEALNVVCGGAETGRMLAQHPGVDGVAFAGSRQVGMEILRAAVSGPSPRRAIVTAGGTASAFVTASANLDAAADSVVRAAFGTQGQRRTAVAKVYVHADVKDSFVAKLLALTTAIRVGDPNNAAVFMGPLIDDAALERYLAATQEVRDHGTLLTGGDRLAGGLYDNGAYVSPAIADGLPPEHRLNREDRDVPLLSVLTFTDLGSAITDANTGGEAPAAHCHTEDADDRRLFAAQARAEALCCHRGDGNPQISPSSAPIPSFMREYSLLGGCGD